MGFQTHTIVGNLGRDPELRYLEDGTPVVNFSVAVNEKRGENETTTWYRVSAWNKLAEHCHQYLEKGRQVLVQGSKLTASAYMNQAGQLQSNLELTAQTIQFLGGQTAVGSLTNVDHDPSSDKSSFIAEPTTDEIPF